MRAKSVPVYAVEEERQHNQGEDQEIELANKLLFNLLLILAEFVGGIVLLVSIVTLSLGLRRVARHCCYQDSQKLVLCVLISERLNKLISIPIFEELE